MGGGDPGAREGLRNVLIEAGDEMRHSLLVAGDRVPKTSLCLSGLVSVEDATEVPATSVRVETFGTWAIAFWIAWY